MTTQVLPTAPQKVSTFGPGGQVYAANLFGGFKLVSGQKQYDFFGISMNSDDPYAKVLTNLSEAGKIGNSMAFTGRMYGIRFVKIDGTLVTTEEAAAMVQFLASSRLEFYVGSNKTKVLELGLTHFLNTVSMASEDANTVSLPVNMAAWLNLPGSTVQGLEPNTEISGSVFMNFPTGTSALLGANNDGTPKFIMQFIIAGEKQTK